MTTQLDEKLEPIFQEVLQRNPGEAEFHQAVREVLESIGPVLAKRPEFTRHRIIERICEPENEITGRDAVVLVRNGFAQAHRAARRAPGCAGRGRTTR